MGTHQVWLQIKDSMGTDQGLVTDQGQHGYRSGTCYRSGTVWVQIKD